jgi:hypothetical protein
MYLALTVYITVYSYMAHSSALNVEAISSCETLVSPYKCTHGVALQTPVIFLGHGSKTLREAGTKRG